MEVQIRELSKHDLKAFKKIRLEMLAMHPKNFGSSVEEEKAFKKSKWVKRIENPKTKSIGAFYDGLLIGIAVLSMNPRKKMKHIGVINSFYVNENYRNKGVAARLLGYIEDLASGMNIVRLNLSVMDKNIKAASFYRSKGFVETGKELDAIFYNQTYYSLLLMTKKIHNK